MSNKINWVEYNKISNKSDAFKQAKNIDPSLSDALENLSSSAGMKGKALPTDRSQLVIHKILMKFFRLKMQMFYQPPEYPDAILLLKQMNIVEIVLPILLS